MPRDGTAGMTNDVLTVVGLPTVLAIGSQFADKGVTYDRGNDASRASYQCDLGIYSSASHIFTRHIGPATQATSEKLFDNLSCRGPG